MHSESLLTQTSSEHRDDNKFMSRKYFGTDGVRGLVGQFPITPDFVMKLGWAAGKVLAKQGTRKVLIGKDTRISGYMLESALEACTDEETCFVIGGAELYRQALPLAQRIHLTEIETDVTGGDAHFPLLPAAEWQEASREAHVSEKGLHYNFVVYSRR